MKKVIFLLALVFMSTTIYAQGFNADKTALTNFLVRMYKHAPFDVKVVNDYNYGAVNMVVMRVQCCV